ncbi:hypothetical protein NECID01_0466 [Nematocida sp. AWRm77]|nr:hypothetical protein NECID01_0466 [Nematocida sp. AWRm77]
MLIEEYLSIIETAPNIVQKTLTEIIELERSVMEDKKLLDKEVSDILGSLEEEELSVNKGELDKQLQQINKSYLKVLDVDKRKLLLLSALQHKLEDTSDMIKESSSEFKEGVAKDSLSLKLQKITDLLDNSIEGESFDEEDKPCCTCKQPAKGEMVVCDNPECPVEWYHAGCVGLKEMPKKKWLCQVCTRE